MVNMKIYGGIKMNCKKGILKMCIRDSDRDGLMMHRRMADKAKELSKEFEEKFGPLTTMNVTNTECFDWIEEPWPWDNV